MDTLIELQVSTVPIIPIKPVSIGESSNIFKAVCSLEILGDFKYVYGLFCEEAIFSTWSHKFFVTF